MVDADGMSMPIRPSTFLPLPSPPKLYPAYHSKPFCCPRSAQAEKVRSRLFHRLFHRRRHCWQWDRIPFFRGFALAHLCTRHLSSSFCTLSLHKVKSYCAASLFRGVCCSLPQQSRAAHPNSSFISWFGWVICSYAIAANSGNCGVALRRRLVKSHVTMS